MKRPTWLFCFQHNTKFHLKIVNWNLAWQKCYNVLNYIHSWIIDYIWHANSILQMRWTMRQGRCLLRSLKPPVAILALYSQFLYVERNALFALTKYFLLALLTGMQFYYYCNKSFIWILKFWFAWYTLTDAGLCVSEINYSLLMVLAWMLTTHLLKTRVKCFSQTRIMFVLKYFPCHNLP